MTQQRLSPRQAAQKGNLSARKQILWCPTAPVVLVPQRRRSAVQTRPVDLFLQRSCAPSLALPVPPLFCLPLAAAPVPQPVCALAPVGPALRLACAHPPAASVPLFFDAHPLVAFAQQLAFALPPLFDVPPRPHVRACP